MLALIVKACELSGLTAAELIQNSPAEMPTLLAESVGRVITRSTALSQVPVDEAVASLAAEFDTLGLEKYLLAPEQRRRLEELTGLGENTDEDEEPPAEVSPGITVISAINWIEKAFRPILCF